MSQLAIDPVSVTISPVIEASVATNAPAVVTENGAEPIALLPAHIPSSASKIIIALEEPNVNRLSVVSRLKFVADNELDAIVNPAIEPWLAVIPVESKVVVPAIKLPLLNVMSPFTVIPAENIDGDEILSSPVIVASSAVKAPKVVTLKGASTKFASPSHKPSSASMTATISPEPNVNLLLEVSSSKSVAVNVLALMVKPAIDPESAVISPAIVASVAVKAPAVVTLNGAPAKVASPNHRPSSASMTATALRDPKVSRLSVVFKIKSVAVIESPSNVNPAIDPVVAVMSPVIVASVATSVPAVVTENGAPAKVASPAQSPSSASAIIIALAEPNVNLLLVVSSSKSVADSVFAAMVKPAIDPVLAVMSPVIVALVAVNAPAVVTLNGAPASVLSPAQSPSSASIITIELEAPRDSRFSVVSNVKSVALNVLAAIVKPAIDPVFAVMLPVIVAFVAVSSPLVVTLNGAPTNVESPAHRPSSASATTIAFPEPNERLLSVVSRTKSVADSVVAVRLKPPIVPDSALIAPPVVTLKGAPAKVASPAHKPSSASSTIISLAEPSVIRLSAVSNVKSVAENCVSVKSNPAIDDVPSKRSAKLSEPVDVYPNIPDVGLLVVCVIFIALFAVPVMLPTRILLSVSVVEAAAEELKLRPKSFKAITGFCIVPPNPPAIAHMPKP